MSAEELIAFDKLLDAPDMDADKQQELLQALWNIIVCIIDSEWEKLSRSSHENGSGKELEDGSECAVSPENMLLSEHRKLTKIHKQAAADKLRRKGHHDSA